MPLKRPPKIPKIAWSLLDQTVVSAGNFLLNILLARSLAPQVYGSFTVLYLVIVSLNTCQGSIVNYWLSVKGATASSDESKKLLTAGLAITIVWGVLFTVVLLIASAAMKVSALWIPASIAMIIWQLQETARRGLLSQLRYKVSIVPDAISYLGQVAILAMLHVGSVVSVFFVIAGTSLVSLTWQSALVGVARLTRQEFARFLKESFRESRFLLVANGLNMLIIQIPVWALLAVAGKSAVAAYQALSNSIGVINPILFGLNNHLVPAVARAVGRGSHFARNIALREGGLAGVLVLMYISVVAVAPAQVLSAAYGSSSHYLVFAPMLRWLMIGCFLYYVGTVFSAYEAGVGRTTSYMYSQLIALAFICGAGIPLIGRFKVKGAILASVAVLLVRTSVLVVISISRDRRKRIGLPAGELTGSHRSSE